MPYKKKPTAKTTKPPRTKINKPLVLKSGLRAYDKQSSATKRSNLKRKKI